MNTRRFSKDTFEKLKNKAQKTLHRSLDQHIKLAVTGFSGSGKTAFITALIKHLTTQADKQNLPFFDVIREQRLIAVKAIPQRALDIPTFDYNCAVNSLLANPPSWPSSTQRINTLTLALKFETRNALKQHLSPISTVYLELIDYPGEWLVDLPMLNQDYQTWSKEVLTLLKQPKYIDYAKEFLTAVDTFDSDAVVDETILKKLSEQYQRLLLSLKQHTKVAQLQPGRMLIPGDLAGAPILLFFPCYGAMTVNDETQYMHLEARFNAYKQQVISPFYKQHFCQFDRQIVLVDMLSALADGPDTLREQEQALRNIVDVFDYGKSNMLKRLFYPKIDKVLFAANKCDHVSYEQQPQLAKLLHSMVHEKSNDLRFAGVEIDTMAVSAVQSTQQTQVVESGKTLNCIVGKPIDEPHQITFLPPQPPTHCLSKEQWPEQGFDFLSFAPLPAKCGNLSHVRLDHVLQFLLGDKLR
ncbi:YcjX family protein [Pseudoalteromonas sp. MMG012]|uniref:YcjX family protein n=1 Tax=Pseudoalteromonas sp. MMG012 TaxID=2822686 RepID=UPI001B3A3468|nr:YcjX family protein [Pseudoalteromonas sp. MMG012]MBQ4848982.1 YcjX family protein [Pseudoalteromonas sp. MMG012]